MTKIFRPKELKNASALTGPEPTGVEDPMRFFTYVAIYVKGPYEGCVAYAGKGTGGRMEQPKNIMFEMLRADGWFRFLKVDEFYTNDEAFTSEAQLDKEYHPMLNVAGTLLPKKWKPRPGQRNIDELLDVSRMQKEGHDTAWPKYVAELVLSDKEIKTLIRRRARVGCVRILLVGDRFGEVTNSFLGKYVDVNFDLHVIHQGCIDGQTAYARMLGKYEDNMRITIYHHNFLENKPDVDVFDGSEFDLVLMNPPFDKGLWKRFRDRALTLLGKGGKLVMILPANEESGYVDRELARRIKFGTMSRKGDAVLIEQGAAPRVIDKGEDKVLEVPGVTMSSGDGLRELDKPAIVFGKFKNPEELRKRCEIVTAVTEDVGSIKAGWVKLESDDPVALDAFLVFLREGGLEHIIKRYTPIFRDDILDGGFGEFNQGKLKRWINEAWRAYQCR